MYRQIACVAVIATTVLGTASLAQAGADRDDGPRAYQVQTWADIERDRQDMARQVEALERADTAGSSYGYVAPHVPRHVHR